MAKCWFPFPPLPPLATTALSPSSFKSAITRPVASSLIIVPGGTLRIKSSPFLPAFLFLLRTVLLPVPSVGAAVFQPTEVCEYQILSTYDVTTGPIDFTVFLNYLLILNCQPRLLNLIIGGMNGSLQICNMILEFFVV